MSPKFLEGIANKLILQHHYLDEQHIIFTVIKHTKLIFHDVCFYKQRRWFCQHLKHAHWLRETVHNIHLPDLKVQSQQAVSKECESLLFRRRIGKSMHTLGTMSTLYSLLEPRCSGGLSSPLNRFHSCCAWEKKYDKIQQMVKKTTRKKIKKNTNIAMKISEVRTPEQDWVTMIRPHSNHSCPYGGPV